AHINPQISRNLLVTAAPAVKFVSCIADQFDKPLLDEMMHIFRLRIVQEVRRISRPLSNLVQSTQYGFHLRSREHIRLLESASMRRTRLQLAFEQPAVKLK